MQCPVTWLCSAPCPQPTLATLTVYPQSACWLTEEHQQEHCQATETRALTWSIGWRVTDRLQHFLSLSIYSIYFYIVPFISQLPQVALHGCLVINKRDNTKYKIIQKYEKGKTRKLKKEVRWWEPSHPFQGMLTLLKKKERTCWLKARCRLWSRSKPKSITDSVPHAGLCRTADWRLHPRCYMMSSPELV